MTRIGLVGLPQSGKTTIFEALTGMEIDASARRQVNTASVSVPDERHSGLCDIFKPKKSVLSRIEFIDVPGVSTVDGPRKSEGGGSPGELLAALREADALVIVARAFQNTGVHHIHGGIDSLRDVEEVRTLLLLADLEVAEKRLEKLKVAVTKPTGLQDENKKELALLERIRPFLESGEGLDAADLDGAEEKKLRAFAFLTRKPILVAANIGDDQPEDGEEFKTLRAQYPDAMYIHGRLQREISELDEADRRAFIEEMDLDCSVKDKLIRRCAELLRLRVFFTVGSDEVRAWQINAGDSALIAAGKIHTDMQRGFIRAEVTSYEDFIECGSEREAKARNKMRLEGRDYVVRDGDILGIRFST